MADEEEEVPQEGEPEPVEPKIILTKEILNDCLSMLARVPGKFFFIVIQQFAFRWKHLRV
jgi:hypothetical protein